MTFREAVAFAVGANPCEPDDSILELLRSSVRSRPSGVACPSCGRDAAKNGNNAAGGHVYRCRFCVKRFTHGGPGRGRLLPAGVAAELIRLHDEGQSIRAACRATGIAKTTGRKLVKRVEAIRHDQIMRGAVRD